jgi:hypothetical protein
MTHTLQTTIKSERFEEDHYRVYLTRDLNWVERNHPTQKTPYVPEGEWGASDLTYDPVLMKRLAASVKDDQWVESEGSMWSYFYRSHRAFLSLLETDQLEKAHDHLSLMYQSPLMDGISQGANETQLMQEYDEIRSMRLSRNWDVFLGVMEYLGVMGPQNHEQGASHVAVDADTFLRNAPAYMVAPKWQGGLWCMKTSKGLFSDRDLMALYVALKIKEKYPLDSRILEIGGGCGYLAYWLFQIGYRNIFTIDIPSVATCQAYQLANNLGAENISLANESHHAPIKFISPTQLPHRDDQFDLVVNCDSMPEMDKDSLTAYLDFISTHADSFYSINHESRAAFNGNVLHVVRSVIKNEYQGKLQRTDRSKFWLRDGYAEEWYTSLK